MMEFDFLMFSQETAIIDISQGSKYASGSAINPVKLIHSSNSFMKITRTTFQTGAFSKKAFSDIDSLHLLTTNINQCFSFKSEF